MPIWVGMAWKTAPALRAWVGKNAKTGVYVWYEVGSEMALLLVAASVMEGQIVETARAPNNKCKKQDMYNRSFEGPCEWLDG